jgi:hypothetical protein
VTAIPQLLGPELPRTETMAYRDDVAFGSPRAQPMTRVQYHVEWTDEQVLDAAQDGAAEAGSLDHVEVATVCQAYLELRERVDALERATAQAIALRECAEAERVRLARLHARVSAENVHLRHQIAGTTPVSVEIALDRAARAITGKPAAELTAELNDRIHSHRRVPEANSDFGDDTVVVDLAIGSYA